MGDWFGFFALLSLAIWTFLGFVLRVLYGLCYSVMMLSKDIFRRYWYYSSSAFSSFSSSRNRPFAEDTWRREFTCMHTLLFCRDCGDSLSG